ncbi:hypothetical protein RPE78_01985 [Thioclava litoralis]|uniref:Uncharacterized protein n=1 Tax=Thioclava litoralis TaxID=3076557 RepID=A0ABZ1E2X1_9RHOB|nr:hypothetical protein RPE78_01985 [Thioclava sp. FTW29]
MKTFFVMAMVSLGLALPAAAETARADLVDAQGQALASVTVADLAPEEGSVRLALATVELAAGDRLGAGVELASASACPRGAAGTLLIPQSDLPSDPKAQADRQMQAQGQAPKLLLPAAGRQKAEYLLPDTDVRSAFLSRQPRAVSLRQNGVQLACALFQTVPDTAEQAQDL